MSGFILPPVRAGSEREPAREGRADLRRSLERRKMAAVVYDLEPRSGNGASHFLVAGERGEGVLPAAEDQRRADDGGQEGPAVLAAHDGSLLPDERFLPCIPGHFLDSSHSLPVCLPGTVQEQAKK